MTLVFFLFSLLIFILNRFPHVIPVEYHDSHLVLFPSNRQLLLLLLLLLLKDSQTVTYTDRHTDRLTGGQIHTDTNRQKGN